MFSTVNHFQTFKPGRVTLTQHWLLSDFKNPSSLELKCPYYGLWKVHILVLGVPNNRLTCMQGQKTLSFSYSMHLFLPYLLNDSQTIRSTIHFSKPLLCVMLIYSDWSDWLISFKAESSAALCTAVTGETAIFNAPKAAPSGNHRNIYVDASLAIVSMGRYT